MTGLFERRYRRKREWRAASGERGREARGERREARSEEPDVRRDLTCRNGRSAAQLQEQKVRKSEGVLESLSTDARPPWMLTQVRALDSIILVQASSCRLVGCRMHRHQDLPC